MKSNDVSSKKSFQNFFAPFAGQLAEDLKGRERDMQKETQAKF